MKLLSNAIKYNQPGGAVTVRVHPGIDGAVLAVEDAGHGLSAERAIRLEADVRDANQRVASQNHRHFAEHGVTALNLVSSPGSGKTTLPVATIEALRQRAPGLAVAVIEGDQPTLNDAERIRATGAPAIQVNTGKGCHLDAPMVAAAFARLPAHGHAQDHGHDHDHAHQHDHDHHYRQRQRQRQRQRSLLIIENVGNLVCPARWDLGEAAKVVILSVTEGEDKSLKYPDMFAAARLLVLNKTDLLPHLRLEVARCIEPRSGSSPPRRRAMPAHRRAPHSGASNGRF